jgi:hypothetical protein
MVFLDKSVNILSVWEIPNLHTIINPAGVTQHVIIARPCRPLRVLFIVGSILFVVFNNSNRISYRICCFNTNACIYFIGSSPMLQVNT